MGVQALELFRELCIACCARAWQLHRESGDDCFLDPDERRFQSLIPPQQKTELEHVLPRHPGKTSGEFPQYLYLEPLKKTRALPVVRCRWNFTDPERPSLSLRITLLKKSGASGGWAAVGLRFESPEHPSCKDPEPPHRFWHVQWIWEIDLRQDVIRRVTATNRLPEGFPKIPSEGIPVWLPEDKPALPIPAVDATDALIIAITSLYGVAYLDELSLPSRPGVQKDLKRRLERMGLRQQVVRPGG